MIIVSEFAGKKVGVFGLGKAGDAAVDSLVAGGAEVFAWDDKPPSSAQKNIQLVHYADWPWADIQALVLSPGVPLTHPKPHGVVEMARAHNVPVIGDVELLWRAQKEARFVGITGTNGKSTTTTLMGHILHSAGIKAEVGGNLGTPALALAPLGKDGVYVIETSSYQLDLLETARFDVAVLLNVTPDHLDRHGDMAGYVAAKMHIFDRQDSIDPANAKDYGQAVSALHDVAVVAVDDDYTRNIAKTLYKQGRKVVEVSAQEPLSYGVSVEDGLLYDDPNEGLVGYLSSIATLTGRHNWQNAAAAYAACRALGIAPKVIHEAMHSFAGLRHRLQLVATIKGVRFINDSKATNADATSNALAPYEGIYWILGGKPKAGGISTLGEYFPKVRHAFLIGEAQEEFAKTLEGKVAFTRSSTLEKAVDQAAKMAFAEARKEAVVLLSPACASFDQFKSFEHRGDVFCELVEKLV